MTDTAKAGRGGYRGGTKEAKFTAQLVALVEPDTRNRVLRMAEGYGVSQAEIMRAIVDQGLARAEASLARRWGPLAG